MNSPDEMIDDWKKHIKKAKRQNELEIIKMDLEAEKDMFEEVIGKYECLIADVDDKLAGEKLTK